MRRQSTSSSDEAERRPRPSVRNYALEFAVVTVLGALPGTRRLNQWWVRQSWRRILLYRLVTAAVGIALVQWGKSYTGRGSIVQDRTE